MAVEVTVTKTLNVASNGVRVALPMPGAGYGGHELVLSGSGRFLALFLYSGQSEFGWELFEVVPRLRHLGSLPYRLGEGPPPEFADDEGSLVIVSTLRDIGPDEDDPSAVVIEWAEVRAQKLPTGPLTLCTLKLNFDEPPTEREPQYPRIAGVRGDIGITIELPWGGQCHVPLPLPLSITVRGPS